MELAASNKFAEDGGSRDVFCGTGLEIREELEQAAGFGILRFGFGNIAQNRKCVRLENTHFKNECGIYHRIRIFLEWIDVPQLPTMDARPAMERIKCRVSTILMVTYNPSNQSVIRSRDGVLCPMLLGNH